MNAIKRLLAFGWRRLLIGAIVVLGLAGSMFSYDQFFREEPPPYFESDEDHFLFGSVGTEAAEGVPYWIWLVLPRLFPDLLPAPGGYAGLGVLAKDGHEMPVGLSKVTIGFPRVGINCAMCHTASVRTRAGELPRLIAAAPSHQTAPQLYLRFLADAAADPRFTAGNILGEISKNYRLSMIDRLLYRFAIIPLARQGLLRVRAQSAWMRDRPEWGRGRIDPFNPVKFRYLGQPIDKTIGNSDMVPLWGFKRYSTYNFHWDGLNTSMQEVVLSSAIGDGATKTWVDRDFSRWHAADRRQRSSLRRVQDYITNLDPPPYPYSVDRTLARQGEAVFARECAACHDPQGGRTGTVVPVSEVGTDRHRLDMWTKGSASAYNAYGQGRPWRFSNFRTTAGYVAVPLDGLWLRAPYLHNGSVPSLIDLLEPPDARPRRFWRGYDLYDGQRVGFVSDGTAAEQAGTLYDTTLPGNSNGGHLYGTTLGADEKRALLEFLKTR